MTRTFSKKLHQAAGALAQTNLRIKCSVNRQSNLKLVVV